MNIIMSRITNRLVTKYIKLTGRLPNYINLPELFLFMFFHQLFFQTVLNLFFFFNPTFSPSNF